MQRKGDAVVQYAAGGTTDPAKMRLQIYPRLKAGQKKRESGTGTAVVVSLEVLNGFADIPLVQVAKKLGISKTALKSACRTLGLERWPFLRPTDCLPAGGGCKECHQKADESMPAGLEELEGVPSKAALIANECGSGAVGAAFGAAGESAPLVMETEPVSGCTGPAPVGRRVKRKPNIIDRGSKVQVLLIANPIANRAQ